MNSNRTSRARLVTAAASVVIAALSLTACNDGTGVKDEGASSGSAAGSAATLSPSASASTSAATGGAKNAQGTQDSQGKKDSRAGQTAAHAPATPPATKAPAATGAPGAAKKIVTCEGSDTKTVAAPLTRPVNHMLLTVTNTGSNSCYLYNYPSVRFGEAQSVPTADASTQPQAVVTLEPGESGYASVRLSGGDDGSGSNGYTAKTLAVYFQGRSGSESVGSGAHPALPPKGVYVDDTLEVTYWQQSMDSVLSW